MLSGSDLLIPPDGVGRLNPDALWPGVAIGTVEDIVDAYLEEGYQKAADVVDLDDRDEAARQWAYYRAWMQRYDDLSSLPASVNKVDEGGSGYTQAQIDSWLDRANSALVTFNALVADAVTVTAAVKSPACENLNITTVW